MEHRATLEALCDLIDHWNRRINLLRVSSRDELWYRHVQDSLQLSEHLRDGTRTVCDIGSGAGMPGLVLAIARPDLTFHLVESDRRKAAFLVEASRTLRLANTTIHSCRASKLAGMGFGTVVARAVARLNELLDLATPMLASDGDCLFPKGANADPELTEALARWTMRVERLPSRTDPRASILRLSGIHRIGAPA